MRSTPIILSLALVAATVLSGCNETQVAQNGTQNGTQNTTQNHLTLPSGSAIEVSLGTQLSSKTASVGTSWNGTVLNALMINGRTVVPAGSSVTGTVTGVKAARSGDRAMLDLGLATVTVDGRRYDVRGGMESVIAGSTRARNLGAIGAATVAGAVVGHQIESSDKGTIIGAVVGGATAAAVVSQTDGYQIVLKSGTPLTFTTSEALAVRS
jgi:hypothetical protein